MATIKVEVEFDSLENEDLVGFDNKLYDFLSQAGRSIPSPFPGTVIDVTETDREEDEDGDEEETA